MLFLGALASCEKEDIENTAVVNVAGQWNCTIDAVDDNGDPITHTLDGQPNSGVNYFGDFGNNGKTIILTYNTSDNSSAQMWVDNLGVGNFAAKYADYWEDYGYYPTYAMKAKVNVDMASGTFSATEAENIGEGHQWWRTDVVLDEKGDTVWADKDKTQPKTVDVMFHEEKVMAVTIEGKILKDAARQNNGSPTDSIVFFVTYKNDPWYPADGYTRYKVSGKRYSGLVENE